MNKYVFVQSSICRMGGSQQYLYGKINFLKKLGWDIKVIVGHTGEAIMKTLIQYENYVPGIVYSTCYFNKRSQQKIINEAIAIIDPQPDDNIYIESSTASTSLWCEMIAKKLNCRHVSFDFEEVFTNLTKSQLVYHDFKHKRRELCGITPQALPLMFKGYKEVSEKEAYSYRAMCSNPIDDVTNEHYNLLAEKLRSYDLVIGTIGRAEKPFLIPTLKGIREYINENPNVKFAVLFIGGAQQIKYEEEAATVFDNVKNADFYCTGRIFPIPRILAETCAAFVSSSGSASATARINIPTVSISPSTFRANGILNYTTRFSAVPDQEVNLTIKSQLYEIIDNKYCKNHKPIGLYGDIPFEKEAEIQFKKQLDFVINNDEPLEYFDISQVKKEGKLALIALFARIIGRKGFLKILKILENSKLTFIKG